MRNSEPGCMCGFRGAANPPPSTRNTREEGGGVGEKKGNGGRGKGFLGREGNQCNSRWVKLFFFSKEKQFKIL